MIAINTRKIQALFLCGLIALAGGKGMHLFAQTAPAPAPTRPTAVTADAEIDPAAFVPPESAPTVVAPAEQSPPTGVRVYTPNFNPPVTSTNSDGIEALLANLDKMRGDTFTAGDVYAFLMARPKARQNVIDLAIARRGLYDQAAYTADFEKQILQEIRQRFKPATIAAAPTAVEAASPAPVIDAGIEHSALIAWRYQNDVKDLINALLTLQTDTYDATALSNAYEILGSIAYNLGLNFALDLRILGNKQTYPGFEEDIILKHRLRLNDVSNAELREIQRRPR